MSIIYLPSMKTLLEKNKQFSDTSCQEEKSVMIDRLIDVSAEIIDSIWSKKQKPTSKIIMPTNEFIREIIQRSRATYSMLRLALFYIFRIRNLIPQSTHCIVCCGRRMFLAALMLASKYLHDRNYRNRTWAKIANLDVAEISASEFVFLKLIDYRLYVSKLLYDRWVFLLHEHVQKKQLIHIYTQQKVSLPVIQLASPTLTQEDDSQSEMSSPATSYSSSSSMASPHTPSPSTLHLPCKKRPIEDPSLPVTKHPRISS